MAGETNIQCFGNFNKKLTKIYIWGNYEHQELGNWGKVTKSWFNPKLSLNPRAIENVLEISIFPSKIPRNLQEIKQIDEKMKSLEKLNIFGQIRTKLPEIGRFISSFTNLKRVSFSHTVPLKGKVFIYKSLGELLGQHRVLISKKLKFICTQLYTHMYIRTYLKHRFSLF